MTFVQWTIMKWTQLGNAVREERRARNMTQQQLADRAGVSRGWLVRFEKGLHNAEPESVFRVLRALDLTLTMKSHHRTEEEFFLDEVLDG